MIVILCSPRTGSSLVTNIVYNHGVWVGNAANAKNVKAYTSFESPELQFVLKRIWKGYKKTVDDPFGRPIRSKQEYIDQVKQCIDDIAPKQETAFKVMCEYAPLFFQFEPKFIFVARQREQAIQSMLQRASNRGYEYAAKIHDARMEYMEQVRQEHGGEWVCTDELIEGKYTSMRKALKYCGLTFRKSACEAAIDKTKWHNKRESDVKSAS